MKASGLRWSMKKVLFVEMDMIEEEKQTPQNNHNDIVDLRKQVCKFMVEPVHEIN